MPVAGPCRSVKESEAPLRVPVRTAGPAKSFPNPLVMSPAPVMAPLPLMDGRKVACAVIGPSVSSVTPTPGMVFVRTVDPFLRM